VFYLDLFRALAKHDVRYVLVGGVAMNLHGVPRMTMDVDIVLAMDRSNLEVFLAACAELQLQPAVPVPLVDLLDPARRRAWQTEKRMMAFPLRTPDMSSPTVDVLIAPPLDIEPALSRAERRRVDDVTVAVAAVEDMIQMKVRAGRAQDLADVEHLRRLQGANE
jgi:Nucleotidyl transferase AbiEii toxin, Type IV TA system